MVAGQHHLPLHGGLQAGGQGGGVLCWEGQLWVRALLMKVISKDHTVKKEQVKHMVQES